MKFEKLSESNGKSRKMFLYGFLMCAVLLIIINMFLTKAKYKVVDSAKLVNSTINYSNADLNVIAMYKNDGHGNETIDTIPKGNYELSNESYCVVGNNKERLTNNISFDKVKVSIDITQKGTKCYLYFNRIFTPEETLANLGIKELPKKGATEFTKIATKEDSGLFSGEDDYGTTYYYRGIVDNNWVKIGEEYWRIIRINGNGTIRLIYNGKTTNATGEETLAKTGVTFNTKCVDNKYVGFMYGTNSTSYEEAHKNEEKSNILTEIENWYINEATGQDLKKYEKYLDGATGFCGDRTKVEGAITDANGTFTNLGFGNSRTMYGAYHRFLDNNDTTHWGNTQNPTFKCGIDPSNKDTLNEEYLKRDLYTTSNEEGIGNGVLRYPIGLITADEVVFAGGFSGTTNDTYWLYTGENYWTMSPEHVWINDKARIFRVGDNGLLGHDYVDNTLGVRPVINLKADTQFEPNGDGSTDHPFTVKLD